MVGGSPAKVRENGVHSLALDELGPQKHIINRTPQLPLPFGFRDWSMNYSSAQWKGIKELGN